MSSGMSSSATRFDRSAAAPRSAGDFQPARRRITYVCMCLPLGSVTLSADYDETAAVTSEVLPMLVGLPTDLSAARVMSGLREPVARRRCRRAGALAPRPAALRDPPQGAQPRHADAAKPGLGVVLVADHACPQRPPRDEAGGPGGTGDAQIAGEHLGRAAAAQEHPRRRPADGVELPA